MKKVLIISYSFPPLNNIAARRFSEIASFFPELGWEPYILTTKSKGQLTTDISEKNIIRLGSYPNDILNSETIPPIKQSYFSTQRKKLGIYFRSFDSSNLSWISHKDFVELSNQIEPLNIDLIIASYGPSATLIIGAVLSKKLNIPWIVDFRDLGALYKDRFSKRYPLIEYIDKSFEYRLIKSASTMTTVSEGLCDSLQLAYRKKTHVIYNGWMSNSVYNKSTLENDIFQSELPYIYYAGRFYQHQMESVFLLIDSLAAQDCLLIIRSLGPTDLEDIISTYARKKQMIEKVKILPPVKPDVIAKEQSNATINLVIEDLDYTFDEKRGVLTGKLLQLLTYSPPILAIARHDSEIGKVLEQSKKGILVSTPREIQVFLEKVLVKGARYDTDFHLINRYSKEEQAKKMIKIMNENVD